MTTDNQIRVHDLVHYHPQINGPDDGLVYTVTEIIECVLGGVHSQSAILKCDDRKISCDVAHLTLAAEAEGAMSEPITDERAQRFALLVEEICLILDVANDEPEVAAVIQGAIEAHMGWQFATERNELTALRKRAETAEARLKDEIRTHNKQYRDLTGDRDDWRTRAETAEANLVRAQERQTQVSIELGILLNDAANRIQAAERALKAEQQAHAELREVYEETAARLREVDELYVNRRAALEAEMAAHQLTKLHAGIAHHAESCPVCAESWKRHAESAATRQE